MSGVRRYSCACLVRLRAGWRQSIPGPLGPHPYQFARQLAAVDGSYRKGRQAGGPHPAARRSRCAPIVAAKVEGGHLLIAVSAAGRGPAVDWDLTLEGGKLKGVQKQGDSSDTQIAGVRAPELKRPMPKAWTAPEPLFNGKDLTGWEPIGNLANNHWAAKDGELVNEARGANIRTTKTFQDFKLHVEVNCPNTLPDGKTQLCNSGIYLRGRDEVQVGTEGGTNPSHEMGALYGFITPAVDMPLGAGRRVADLRHHAGRPHGDGGAQRREDSRQRGDPRHYRRRAR